MASKRTDYNRTYSRKWRAQNREKNRTYMREYMRANHHRYTHAEARLRSRLKFNLKHGYRLSLDEYNEMLATQGGRCAICGGHNNDGRRLNIDHCHETGQVRGLLCNRCNLALGHLEDNIYRAMRMIDYLLKW